MRKVALILTLLTAISAFGQTDTFDWESIKNNKNISQAEASWLYSNLTKAEFNEVIDLVSALSQPAASQLLVGYFYVDGSFRRKSIKPYLETLSVRPPDGDAGIIKVAYLVSKLRKELIDIQKSSKYYVAQFSGAPIEQPEFNESHINKNIELSFDYQPAQVVLEIISNPDTSYQEIFEKINLHQFDKLIKHHNQSFYPTPLTKERLASCLQIASSTKPVDNLYKHINPYGLLNLTDVKNNLVQYKKQIYDLSENEQSIFEYINASISPYLPAETKFNRKVSFFFINGADGWSTDGVTAIDLNYYKDDYKKLFPLLVHETYHSGQSAVAINNRIEREESAQSFIDAIDYLSMEGTASYVAPPAVKTKLEKTNAVEEGIELLEGLYTNTIVDYDAKKSQEMFNKGIAGAGPFYWLGAEMSKVIVDEVSSDKLAETIPHGGIAFFKAYFSVVKQSEKTTNLFSEDLTKYILEE